MRKRAADDVMTVEPSDGFHSDTDTHGSGGKGLRGDVANICLLVLLYVLQGIPLGLAAAIPMMLQNRGVTYSQQAEFSFAFWPFSLKLLWAPIVDACYVTRFGRRKSWLVPVQYLIGFFLMVLSTRAEALIGTEDQKPNVALLTTVFFSLNFLAATQDIAVDGWALTILQKRNVGHASTCNSVGQSAGYFLGFVVFIALESAEFCNKYLRAVPQPQGLVTFSGFMLFWAVIFLLTTTAVALFKHESPLNRDGTRDPVMDVGQTYSQLVKITSLKPVRTLIIILLTVKIGFSAADAVTGLKLMEAGVPKDRLALMAVPMSPLQVLLPLFISKYTTGPRPMNLFLRAMPWRLMFGLVMAGLVYVTPLFRLEDASFPLSYYALILVVFVLHQVALYSMFVSVMAFYARIADPAIGGTYMTLLNTVTNLGGNWPATMMLWMVDRLTWKTCSSGISCSVDADCGEGEGAVCTTSLDGYYVESLLCFCFGFLWLLWGHRRTIDLQKLSLSAWRYRKTGV